MKSLGLHKGGLKKASGDCAAYFLRAAFALFFAAMVSSCQTLPTTVKIEQREMKSLKELQEYMGYALRGRDFDVETLLMLTEEYFKEADEILKEMEKEPAPGTLPPGLDHSALIRDLRALVKKYPYKPGMAPVHYTLGSLLREGGQLNDAMTVFEGFVKRYKEHPYFAEVSFRLGEIYFDTDQFGEARDAYERVFENPDPVFREKVIYKLGWTHYKLEEFKRAFSYFARLLEGIPEGNLKKRAFKNVVMCLSHMQFDDIEGAVEGFGEKDYAPGVVLELARVFYEQTRFEEAIRTYTLFRTAFGQDPLLPFVYGETAGAYERLKKYELALGIREEAVEKFNPASRWYAKAYPEGNPEVDSLVAESLLAVATYYSKRGKESRDADGALKKAIRAYKSYLSHFPESQDGRLVRLLLAEELFEAGEYLEASISYESVMHLYGQTSEGEDAAFAALLCHELIAARGAEVDTESTAASIKRITESFEAAFPKSNRLNMLRRKAADMYVRMGYYEEARGVLAPLVKADNAAAAAAAYKKTGDIFMAEKDLQGAIHAYTKALEITEDKELRTKLAQLHYMAAVDSVKVGRQDEAASHYLKVFKNLKDSELSENALLNVGRIYIEAGDMERFGTVLEVLRTNYPGSKGLLGLSVEAGKMLERKGLFTESARMFEEASRLAVGAEGEDAYLRLTLKTATLLEKADEFVRLEALLGKLYEDGVINEKRRTEVLYMLGVARLKNGKTDEGIKTLELISDETSGPYYVSKARLRLAGEKVRDFKALKIVQPFLQNLMKKEALLTELIEDLSYVVQSGVARLLPEAFYQMGLVFENFKDSLIESERPVGLSTEELEEYVFLLEEKAYPFEEKAVKAYESALRASIELWEPGGKSAMTASRTVERLSRLRPALYKRELATGKAILFVEPEPISKPVI